MAIISGLALIGVFAALLWWTQHMTYLHIGGLSATIPTAFLFGHQFGLSAGFLIAISIITVEIVLIQLTTHELSDFSANGTDLHLD